MLRQVAGGTLKIWRQVPTTCRSLYRIDRQPEIRYTLPGMTWQHPDPVYAAGHDLVAYTGSGSTGSHNLSQPLLDRQAT